MFLTTNRKKEIEFSHKAGEELDLFICLILNNLSPNRFGHRPANTLHQVSSRDRLFHMDDL